MSEEVKFLTTKSILNTVLAVELIAKNAIRVNTEVETRYYGVDLGGTRLSRALGTFMIRGAKKVRDRVVFEGIDTRDGTPQTFDNLDIVLIDGMDPVRFANNFGLTEAGQVIKEGKRRGRKPKNHMVEIA